MNLHRYADVTQFVRELQSLNAFPGEYVGKDLLESLEAARLLIPRARIRFPAPIARRIWAETHEGFGQLRGATEPEGPRWDAAVVLSEALRRWNNHTVYGHSPHPLDDPDARFAEFISYPAQTPFLPWQEMRVDVSNDMYPALFDDSSVRSYYSGWQLLLAAEVADAGVHFRIDLSNEDIARRAWEAVRAGRVPGDNPRFNLRPVHAARDLMSHERALDCVVWFAEESNRSLQSILHDQTGGRFRLTDDQNRQYAEARAGIAGAASTRFECGTDDLINLSRCLAERWAEWTNDGGAAVAEAYKELLAESVRLTMLVGGLKFEQVVDAVGGGETRMEPILNQVWPDWARQERERVRRTLISAVAGADNVRNEDIDAFVQFLSDAGLEAFFWRLHSFEEHAFHGNSFAIEAMKSDVQGMAIAVEHVAAALGGTETQLYEKFKQIWTDPTVLALLRANRPLAVQARLADDWPALKASINELRIHPGGRTAADLIMAHRIRGGVHNMLPERDQFELEGLFVTLMRAALLTFVEVRVRRVDA